MIIRLIGRIRSNVLPHPGLRWQLLCLELRRSVDDLCLTVAGMLPPRLVYWATIQAMAETTTGEYGSTVVPELRAMEVLKRYDRLHHVHPPPRQSRYAE